MNSFSMMSRSIAFLAAATMILSSWISDAWSQPNPGPAPTEVEIREAVSTYAREVPDSQRAAALKITNDGDRGAFLGIQSMYLVKKTKCAAAKGAPGYVCEYQEGRRWPDGRVQYNQSDSGRFFKTDMGFWKVEYPKP